MIGFRVNADINRPDPDLVARLSAYASTDFSDVMRGSGTMGRWIAPAFSPMPRIAGPAITVSIPTASMSILRVAFQQARPGDIIVVNGMGNMATALVGANMIRGLLHRGAAGIIFDGAIRDITEIRADGLPVFARGVTTAEGPDKPEAGEVNFPIACGGVVVNPGDIVVADEDGIAVIPPAHAEQVLTAVKELDARHAGIQPALLQGEVPNYASIEQELRDAGCAFEK